MRTLINQIISLVFLSFSCSVWAVETRSVEYYVVIFGYQDGGLNLAGNSHSFATFMAVDTALAPEPVLAESFTISWLPESGKVKEMLLLPETGKNVSLDETLAHARLANRDIRRWGPVKINEDLFFAGRRRVEFLESGRVAYVANDLFLRGLARVNLGGAINCIHAVSDIIGNIPTQIEWGHAASKHIFELMTETFSLDRSPEPLQEILAEQLGVVDITRAD